MDSNMSFNEVLATSLMQYNQSKIVATQHKESDIEKFCDQRIVYYCSGLNKGGHIDDINKTLEEMKKSQPEYTDAIDMSIRDLKSEKFASELSVYGKAQADAKTEEEWVDSSVQIKEHTEFIPNEMVGFVKHNLTVKSEMEEFASEHHAIANAILAINLHRFEDLNTTASQPTTGAEITE